MYQEKEVFLSRSYPDMVLPMDNRSLEIVFIIHYPLSIIHYSLLIIVWTQLPFLT